MSTITYMLGAGASYGRNNDKKKILRKLPLVSDFPEWLQFYATQHIGRYKFEERTKSIPNETKANEIRNKFIESVMNLKKKCTEHYSIDTYARKLYLQKRYKEYNELKVVLNEFLMYFEIRNGVDLRYDAFFAALLERNHIDELIPPNIQIVSWNYDRQIELSLSIFLQRDLNKVREWLEDHDFNLLKLNGSIGSFMDQDLEVNYLNHDINTANSLNGEIKNRFIQGTLERYNKAINSSSKTKYDNPILNFSWEAADEEIIAQNNPIYLDSLDNTETLVVIGYSFPTFNRKADKEILGSMPYLKNIHLQIPSDNYDGVKQRIYSLIKDNRTNVGYHEDKIIVHPQTDMSEFYIPFDLI